MTASTVRRKSNQPNPSEKTKRTPRKISEIIEILHHFPTGLASTQISSALRGISAASGRSAEITQARIAATRKQIQRTKNFLARTGANLRIEYCGKNRVWRAILL